MIDNENFEEFYFNNYYLNKKLNVDFATIDNMYPFERDLYMLMYLSEKEK